MAREQATGLDLSLNQETEVPMFDTSVTGSSVDSLSSDMSQTSSENSYAEDMNDLDNEGRIPDEWEHKNHELKSASYDFNSLLKQLDAPKKKASPSAFKSTKQRSPYTKVASTYSSYPKKDTKATSTFSSLQQKLTTIPPSVEPQQDLKPPNIDQPSKPDFRTETNSSMKDSHSFDHNYLALVPPDQTQIWFTNITFTIKSNENINDGIKQRLLAFVPTVVAKSRGNILAWEAESDLNPIRDLHTVCDTNLLAKYFKYQILTNGRVKGYMKFQVYSEGYTFNYIKHKVDIVKQALAQYPIFWTNSSLTTTESVTPVFLVGLSKAINLKQLKTDLLSHTGVNFPIDLHRRIQEARGTPSGEQNSNEKDTLKIHVIKVSCAKTDSTELREKLFSSLGAGAAFAPELQYSALPYVKVMSPWREGPWTEQMIYHALEYQKNFEATTVALEVHNVASLTREIILNETSQPLQAHLASFLVDDNRVVYSIDKAGIDRVWITVKTKYAMAYKEYLDSLFTEMHNWSLEQVHAVTDCWRRPCWSNAIDTLTGAEQDYFSREQLILDSSQFPSLPVARMPNRSWPQKQSTSQEKKQLNKATQPTAPPTKSMKALSPAPHYLSEVPYKTTPSQSPSTEAQDIITMIKAISAEVHTIKQVQTHDTQTLMLRLQKLTHYDRSDHDV